MNSHYVEPSVCTFLTTGRHYNQCNRHWYEGSSANSLFALFQRRRLYLQGNDHVIYNGSFFYYNHQTESIVRYQLNTKSPQKVKIHRNRVVVNKRGELLTQLYKPLQEGSYFDFLLPTMRTAFWECSAETSIL